MNHIPEGVKQAAVLLQQQREISLLQIKLDEVAQLCKDEWDVDTSTLVSKVLQIIERKDA